MRIDATTQALNYSPGTRTYVFILAQKLGSIGVTYGHPPSPLHGRMSLSVNSKLSQVAYWGEFSLMPKKYKTCIENHFFLKCNLNHFLNILNRNITDNKIANALKAEKVSLDFKT